ncbi:MAG: hypothetical protein ETSY1_11700 [Candidatus Entotheonella factor]|uniref:Uncharacterized protein n=1 Tax=Entotheonella factor TaxID=1429438 RepID=W4LRI2_ENTF1|nr:MAG: hypothetical protein ETSY1_11700 [Candidatus Entotheonella factor]
MVPDTEALLSIGMIKRSSEQYLVIRNKCYEQFLSMLFQEGESK